MNRKIGLIVLLMTALCVGCGKRTEETATPSLTQTPAPTIGIELTYSAAKDYPDKPVLLWIVPFGIATNDCEVYSEFNRLLDAKGYPFAVDFYSMDGPDQYMKKLHSLKEARISVDVFNTGFAMYEGLYPDCVSSGLCEGWNGYLSGEGASLASRYSKLFWQALSVNGEVYGIHPNGGPTYTRYFYYMNHDYAERYGVDTVRLATDMSYRTELLKRTAADEPAGKPVLLRNVGTTEQYPVDYIRYADILGVGIRGDRLQAENLLNRKDVREAVLTYVELSKSGRVENVNEESEAELAERILHDDGVLFISNAEYHMDDVICVKSPIIPRNLEGGINCVASWSSHREEAFRLLDAVYSDIELSTLLAFGIEGKHYTITDKGITPITSPEERYEASWAICFLANTAILPPYDTEAYASGERNVISEEDELLLVENPLLGFHFSLTDYQAEIQRLHNLTYNPAWYYREKAWEDADPEQLYDDCVSEWNTLLNPVIAEMNRQLEAYRR